MGVIPFICQISRILKSFHYCCFPNVSLLWCKKQVTSKTKLVTWYVPSKLTWNVLMCSSCVGLASRSSPAMSIATTPSFLNSTHRSRTSLDHSTRSDIKTIQLHATFMMVQGVDLGYCLEKIHETKETFDSWQNWTEDRLPGLCRIQQRIVLTFTPNSFSPRLRPRFAHSTT